jgi:hypothetical protein
MAKRPSSTLALPPALLKAQRQQEEAIEEVQRWVTEPLYWGRRFGGEEFDPWSGQEDLWRQYGALLNAKLKRYQCGPEALTPDESALADKMGISVMAGHGMGKERSVAAIGLHYLSVLKVYQPKGVCTAPAGPTLHSTLWPEFGKVIAGSEFFSALFEKQSDRIYLKEDKRKGEFCRIEPRTIQQNSKEEDQGVVLAGIHATGVIYLITEASGVPEAVFKPIEGGLTDPLSLIIMIFNPTRRMGFAAESQTKNRKHWICLQWDGLALKKEKLASPGRFLWYNERAQDQLIEKYGLDSDTVRIRVRGLPPQQSADTLIHYDAAMEAAARAVETLETDPLCIFADIGGEGDDPSIVSVLRGPKLLKQVEFLQKDTTQLSDAITDIAKQALSSLGSDVQYAIGVDTIGLGRGVYDQLVNVQRLQHVFRLDVSELPLKQKEFHRMRDQVWWELREGFMETKEISLPLDMPKQELDELIGELTSIKWAEVLGKVKVQGKGGSSGIPGVKPLTKSPNRGDSLCGAWYLFKHAVSRMPSQFRRQRRIRQRPVNWKTI